MEFKTVDDLKKYIKLLDHQKHHPEDYVFGIELEGALVDTEGKPIEAKEVISYLNNVYHEFEFAEEAGACQIEIRSFPRNFSTDVLRECEEYLLDAIYDIVEIAEKLYKKEVIFLLIGSNPHPDVLSDKWISNTERAITMAKWRSQFQTIKIAGKEIRPEHIALSIQSMHIHIQGRNPEDVTDKYNHLLYMIPEHIAISANSPIIGGKAVDYSEARLLLYEMADGGNAGLPKLKKYPTSILEYGEYVSSFKPIMAKNIAEMIKERHEDNRIRFEIPFRVENRICPAQSTIRENMALIEYIIGRLKYAQRWSRQDYPSLKEIEINRIEAIKNSIKGNFIWNGKTIPVKKQIGESIEKAEKGLKVLDSNPRYLRVLKKRLIKKKTSADVVRRWYERANENNKIEYLVNKIWEHTKKNSPLI